MTKKEVLDEVIDILIREAIKNSSLMSEQIIKPATMNVRNKTK